MAGTGWIIQVNEDLKNMEGLSTEKHHWNKGSIYKLPASLTDMNKKAYKPQTVSFGPYHYDPSNPMEEHKHRALLHFLKRCGKSVELFVDALAEVENDLKDSYTLLHSVPKEVTDIFLQLMILDGCFMLEILRTAAHVLDDYAPNDPIFGNHGRLHVVPYINRDMLMLENQLPMLVLEKLVAVEHDKAKDEGFVTKLILKFLCSCNVSPNMGKCVHVLDVYRKSLLQHEPDHKYIRHNIRLMERDDEIIWSATALNEAGIRFKKSATTSLKDITFARGVLRLPVVVVDDTTESMFLNLMAFERFHVGAGNEVTSYLIFMDNIIDNARDVSLLHSKGIIHNSLGSDKAVANLFNSLSKDVTQDPDSSLQIVHKRVYHYCRKPWNRWRANLIHTYFRNPWAVISFVAAVFLFVFTIAQTGYSIYPYYFPPNDSSSSTVILVPAAPPPPNHSSSDSTCPSTLVISFILVSMVCMLTN
ncbi:UPF0481 protein At3g47200-like [Rosa rugosa]|uniref:UPF0481 protein At3g47200-like n=1 Tax=Rosa rugosa TaxID=74645 RepID=UPI002B4040CC|nr:UPF0481 protein At3g47200-like [Rosa rugosa]